MKTIALVSGGKDSCFNILHCIAQGHDVVALANLYPQHNQDELDSQMFQTVGHDWIELYASCFIHPTHSDPISAPKLPLFRKPLSRTSVMTQLTYQPCDQDEVEDLFLLLQEAKQAIPNLQAVSVGAILSSYQRIRVENVCQRLGLTALAYLWEGTQELLLQNMIDCGLHAVLIKVASLGLTMDHLGKSLTELQSRLIQLSTNYGCNPCGEGGEYETFTLDCPAFRNRLCILESHPVALSQDPYAPSGFLKMKKIQVIPKPHPFNYTECRVYLQSILTPPIIDEFPLTQPFVHSSTILPSIPLRPFYSLNLTRKKPSITMKFIGNYFTLTGACTLLESTTDLSLELNDLFQCIHKLLTSYGVGFSNFLFVQLGVKDMNQFSTINQIYSRYFASSPSSRACVQLDIPHSVQFDAIGIRQAEEKQTLHIQSISYWAPANIGPYSQYAYTKKLGFVAGQIGLVPETMSFPSTHVMDQCYYALRHVHRIGQCRLHYVSCIGYVQVPEHMNDVMGFWNSYSSVPLYLAAVPMLPRNAMVEFVPWGQADSQSKPCHSLQLVIEIIELLQVKYEIKFSKLDNVCHLGIQCHQKDVDSNPLLDFESLNSMIFKYLDKFGLFLDQLLFTQVFYTSEIDFNNDTFSYYNPTFVPCRALSNNAQVLISLSFVLGETKLKL